MGRIFFALALAALLLAAPAPARNPDGAGQVSIGGLSAWGRPVDDDFEASGQHDYDQLKSGLTWGLGAVTPLNDAWSALLSGADDQWSAVWGSSLSAAAYDEQRDYHSSSMAVGIRFYSYRLAHLDWDPTTDPAGGVALWPVLTLQTGWTQASEHWSLLDNNGFIVNVPPDGSQQSVDLGATLDLPLTPSWALSLAFDQQAYAVQSQAGQLTTLKGGPAVLGGGVDFAFNWRSPVMAQPVFPGLGRLGRVHLRADAQVSWAGGLGATQLSQAGSLSAGIPLGGPLALRLGFQANDAGGDFYLTGNGVPLTRLAYRSQSVFGSLMMSFGDAGIPRP
jgi:hypothetical protein